MRAAYSNQNPNAPQELDWVYFHEVTIATGATAASFFGNTAAATAEASNFPANGQLPEHHSFLIDWIGFRPLERDAAGAAHIVRDIFEMTRARVNLTFNGLPMREDHLHHYPAGGGVNGFVTDGAGALAVHYVGNGLPAVGNRIKLDPPLYLKGQRVALDLVWSTAIVLGQSVRLRAYLGGVLSRPSG